MSNGLKYTSEETEGMAKANLLYGTSVTMSWEDWATLITEVTPWIPSNVINASMHFIHANENEITLILSGGVLVMYRTKVQEEHKKMFFNDQYGTCVRKGVISEGDSWYSEYLSGLYAPAVEIPFYQVGNCLKVLRDSVEEGFYKAVDLI